MEPVKRDDHNFTYRGPTPDIGDLSCRRVQYEDGSRAVVSHFQPSAEELAVLNAGGHVELALFTEPIPPVSVNVAMAEGEENGHAT